MFISILGVYQLDATSPLQQWQPIMSLDTAKCSLEYEITPTWEKQSKSQHFIQSTLHMCQILLRLSKRLPTRTDCLPSNKSSNWTGVWLTTSLHIHSCKTHLKTKNKIKQKPVSDGYIFFWGRKDTGVCTGSQVLDSQARYQLRIIAALTSTKKNHRRDYLTCLYKVRLVLFLALGTWKAFASSGRNLAMTFHRIRKFELPKAWSKYVYAHQYRNSDEKQILY